MELPIRKEISMIVPQDKETRLKMRGILTAIAIACASLLSGCSFLLAAENSDPYTPDDVIDMVASEFAVCQPHLILQSTEREKDKPFQRNIYVFHDEANDFTFACKAVIRRPTLPLPCAQRDTNAYFAYAEGYAGHLNPSIRTMAAKYGFRCATTAEAAALIQSKVKRRQGDREFSLFDEGDFIFVSDGVKGTDVAAVCKGLYNMYRPKEDGTLLSTLYGRKITFYYLPSGEEDLTQAIFVLSFTLKGRHDWAATLSDNPGPSSNEKDPAAMEKGLAQYFDHCLHNAQSIAAQRRKHNPPSS